MIKIFHLSPTQETQYKSMPMVEMSPENIQSKPEPLPPNEANVVTGLRDQGGDLRK